MTDSVEVFTVPDPDGFDTLFAQRFDESQNPVGNVILISPLHTEARLERTIMLDDGGFVVAFSDVDPAGASGPDDPPTYLYTKRFSSDGTLVKTSLVGIDPPSADAGYSMTSILGAVALSAGSYAAIIRHDGIDVSSETLRYVDAAGNETDFRLFTTNLDQYPALVHSDAVMARKADGGFTVSWSASYPAGPQRGAEHFTQSYDATGHLVTTTFVDFGHKIDLVTSSVGIVLSPTLHNLTLTGDDPINARANALDNVVTGNAAINHLTAGGGDDRLDGGLGSDFLGGGTGRDVFVFDFAIAPRFNSDTIGDFAHGQDRIELSSAVFTHLARGTLSATDFTDVGSASAHIIYDARGNLLYDPDGAGAASAIRFATLNGHPHLTASDIVVI